MLLGFHHVAIATSDLARLSAFYRDKFGMAEVAGGEWAGSPETDAVVGLRGSAARFVLLRVANLALEIFEYSEPRSVAGNPERPVSEPGITHIGFAVDDLDADYARLLDAGVRFHGPPPTGDDQPPLRAVYGRDPDGNVFELMEFVGDTMFDYRPDVARWRATAEGIRQRA